MRYRSSSLLIGAVILALAMLACGTSGQTTPTAAQVGEITPTATQAGEAGPTPTTPPSATDTPAAAGTPAVSDTPACTLDASWVADVTIPDNTPFTPGSAFVKIWRVQNSGSCAWEAGTQLVYVSGDPLGGPTAVDVPATAVGANVDVSVNLVAPGAPGTYRSNWRMQSPGGAQFGSQFYVQIVVPEPTATPTNTPLPPTDTPPPPTDTPTPTNTPPPPTTQPATEWSTYRSGDQGPVVAAIQYLLRAEAYTLTADGIFGPQTNTAVRDFQATKGLAADGIVGPNTWTALTQAHTVQQGISGDAVRAVQHVLSNAYGYSIAVDGIFGPNTNTAVRAFQESHGLAVDGIVGPNTWRTLTARQ